MCMNGSCFTEKELTLIKKDCLNDWFEFLQNNSKDDYSLAILLSVIAIIREMEKGETPETATLKVYGILQLNDRQKQKVAENIFKYYIKGSIYQEYWEKAHNLSESKTLKLNLHYN